MRRRSWSATADPQLIPSNCRIHEEGAIVTNTVWDIGIGGCRAAAVLLGACLALWTGIATATSVREASVDELVDQSEVVFEGTVVDVRSRKSAPGMIVTDVVFEVTDVIKGHIPQRRLTLEFLGGEVDGEALSVPAMGYPEVGERGIYFAESAERRLINPLYGWDQGRFLVTRDETGVERVSTARNQRVMSIERERASFFETPGAETRLSSGVAKGVGAKRGAALGEGMSPGQFKQRIRDMMRAAQ